MSVVLETIQLLNGIKFKNGQLSLKEMGAEKVDEENREFKIRYSLL